MPSRLLFLVCRTIFIFMWLLGVFGQAQADIGDASPALVSIAFLTDRPGHLDIGQVAQRPAADFTPAHAGVLARGYTREIHWLRMEVRLPAGESWLEVLPPILDDVRLFVPDAAVPSGYVERRAGDHLPFFAREVPYRGLIFKLKQREAGTQVLYLRLQTSSTSLLIPRVWAPQDFFVRAALENGLLFATLAVILAVLLLNFNALFVLQEALLIKGFMAYLLFVAALIAGNSGLLHQYAYPQSIWLNDAVVGFVSLALISIGNFFYRRLFMIGRDEPWLYGLYQVMTWGPLLAMLPAAFGYYTEIMALLTLPVIPMSFLGCGLAYRLWRRGAPGGSMVFVATLVSLGGILVFVLTLHGIMHSSFVYTHGLNVAAIFTILALQASLGTRYRALRDAQLQAQESERRALQQADQERESRQRQGRFLNMLAHELRTSLSVVQLALGRQPMQPKNIEHARQALQSVGEVIEHSIQSGQLEEGKITPRWSECDLGHLLEEVVARSRDPRRVLLQSGAGGLCTSDPDLLKVVFSNLLDNALKYGDPAQPVEVALHQDAQGWRVTVGNAIGPCGAPDPQHLFEKYYRSPHAHAQIGSGLGLHICRTVAGILGLELRHVPQTGRVVFELGWRSS